MSTFAFLYPGQGAQAPGMGRALYDSYQTARDAFQLSSRVLGRDMAALCFESDKDTLSQTENAQPALFTVSMAVHRILAEGGLSPKAVAGFSLGECPALCAAGHLSWEDGLRMVQVRAESMQREAGLHPGAMAAILGLDFEAVEALCHETGGFVRPVNDNAPGQVVAAGAPDAVKRLAERALEAGAKKVVPLALSAAFHTADMAQAGRSLEEFMRTLQIHDGQLPVYTNVTGGALPASADLPSHMGRQLQSPVRWQDCIRGMLSDGIDTFVEVGEGKTLSGFVRRIEKSAVCLTAGSLEGVENVLNQLSAKGA